MTRRVKVEVTMDDVVEATRLIAETNRRSNVCPIALAINRATGIDNVNVGFASFGREGFYPYHEEVALPDHAVTWRQNFDYSRPVEPMTFEVEVPW